VFGRRYNTRKESIIKTKSWTERDKTVVGIMLCCVQVSLLCLLVVSVVTPGKALLVGSQVQQGLNEDESRKGDNIEREKKENWRLQNYDRTGLGGLDYDFGGRSGNIHKKLDTSRFGGDSARSSDFPKRFDNSRWGGGSDGHLYDFAKKFDSSRWGGGSDGHLYDFAKRFDNSRWGGGSWPSL